ncbi:MAG: UDP-N-acetylmuramoyl-L-alanine--D-glutamate ligase [Candidatus Marinimicrobia bacterium]|nr:UDP-N-acetylmuramoyl-L-alanine--D-glutamate ligase [Candidatus Neomarinimicrobiota bacterium]
MIDISNIHNVEWKNTKISVLGAGKSGIAATNLALSIGAHVLISEYGDFVNISTTQNLDVETGGHSDKVLDSDVIIISPGISDKIDIVQKCKELQIPIVSEIEFSSWFTTSPILAITGSNGKTTTTSLLHKMVENAGHNAMLGGNIGIPFSQNVSTERDLAKKNTVHILELSSFQLEHIELFSPHISCILNISPDHMNRYDSMADYLDAKLNIAKNLVTPAWLVYNAADPALETSLRDRHRTQLFSRLTNQQVNYHVNGEKVYTGSNENPEILFYMDETVLKGPHNIENIIAAATMANLFGIQNSHISNAIKNFKAIEHRMELVHSPLPLNFINDSKATNIASTIAAINSFENITLILGGKDKGDTDFSELFDSMKKSVNHIVCYGDAAESIHSQISSLGNSHIVYNFTDAVLKSVEISENDATILLSPACASFDQFDNYEIRGNRFKELVNSLGELNE